MRKILGALLISVIIISCSKYEDGPAMSLWNRKTRIVNNWQLELIENTVTGSIQDTSLSRLVWGFEENGDFWKSDNTTGEWEFLDELTLKITFENNNNWVDSSEVYTVSRLAKKQLWLKEQYPADTVKYHFVPV